MSKNPENPRKSQKELTQEKLLQALLQYPTVKAAAESIGITDRTAFTYLEDPAFQKAYEQARLSITTEMRNGLVSLASKASQGLYDMMDDVLCPPAIKARVYQFVYDRAIPAPVPSVDPLQGNEQMGVLVPHELLQYIAPEELANIEKYIENAEGRKALAESDIQQMERKRG